MTHAVIHSIPKRGQLHAKASPRPFQGPSKWVAVRKPTFPTGRDQFRQAPARQSGHSTCSRRDRRRKVAPQTLRSPHSLHRLAVGLSHGRRYSQSARYTVQGLFGARTTPRSKPPAISLCQPLSAAPTHFETPLRTSQSATRRTATRSSPQLPRYFPAGPAFPRNPVLRHRVPLVTENSLPNYPTKVPAAPVFRPDPAPTLPRTPLRRQPSKQRSSSPRSSRSTSEASKDLHAATSSTLTLRATRIFTPALLRPCQPPPRPV